MEYSVDRPLSTDYVVFEDAKRPASTLSRGASTARGAAVDHAVASPSLAECVRAFCRRCRCFSTPAERRLIRIGTATPTKRRYPHNGVKNTKYGLVTFVPKILYEQFRYFFNLYYLVVALSQFVPPLEIGLRFTYIAPLVFVLAITMAKEAYDDIQRWRTDRAINNVEYDRLLPGGGVERIKAMDLQVGHIIRVQTDQRVPADLVLLRTHDASGIVFVRTDGLDGETDSKLRLAAARAQLTLALTLPLPQARRTGSCALRPRARSGSRRPRRSRARWRRCTPTRRAARSTTSWAS